MGAHLVEGVPRAQADESAAEIVERLRAARHAQVEAVYVVDEEGRLQGIARLEDLLAAPADRPVGDLMLREPAAVQPSADQEHAATAALRNGLVSVPVVDDRGRLLGAVPGTTILRILRHEHVEDLHRLAGIRHETMTEREALEASPARRARHRLPWLVVGLFGSMLAALVVAQHEEALRSSVAIAFFVPAIVYIADAVGTQTEAIVVRGLSHQRVKWTHLLRGELGTGAIIGLVLAALALPIVWIVFGDGALAWAVALSILVASSAASAIGLLFPCMLARLGVDPAFGGGPLGTIVQDLVSLLVYFGFAQAFM